MTMLIFTLILNKIFIRALKLMRKVATASISICRLDRPKSHVSYPRGKVGSLEEEEGKVTN